MKKVYRFISLFLVLVIAGCSGVILPFGSQGGEPRPVVLYCEYAVAHDVIQFTPDGQYLLSGNCLWQMSSPIKDRPLLNLNSKPVEKKDQITNNMEINAMRFFPSPDLQHAAVLDYSGNLRLLSYKDRKLSEQPWTSRVETVLFLPDGSLITRDFQTTLAWKAPGGERLFGPLANAEGTLDATGLLLSPDGRLLAAWAGPALDLFDLSSSGAFVRRFGQGSGDVSAVAFSPDNQSIAVARAGGAVEVYALSSSEPRLSLSTNQGATANRLLFSPDSSRLAASAPEQQQIEVWDAASGELAQAFDKPIESRGEVYRWAFLPGGQLFVVFADGVVAAWNLADGRPIYAGEKVDVSARRIVVWPDASKFAVFAGNLTIYQSSDGSQLRLDNVLESDAWKRATGITSGDVDVESLAVSPDLKWVAIQLFNQNAILWPIE